MWKYDFITWVGCEFNCCCNRIKGRSFWRHGGVWKRWWGHTVAQMKVQGWFCDRHKTGVGSDVGIVEFNFGWDGACTVVLVFVSGSGTWHGGGGGGKSCTRGCLMMIMMMVMVTWLWCLNLGRGDELGGGEKKVNVKRNGKMVFSHVCRGHYQLPLYILGCSMKFYGGDYYSPLKWLFKPPSFEFIMDLYNPNQMLYKMRVNSLSYELWSWELLSSQLKWKIG